MLGGVDGDNYIYLNGNYIVYFDGYTLHKKALRAGEKLISEWTARLTTIRYFQVYRVWKF